MKLLPLIVLLAVPAFADPQPSVQEQWDAAFTDIVRVHGQIKALGENPDPRTLNPLAAHFDLLKDKLIRLSERLLQEKRRAATRSALDAGAGAARRTTGGPGWTSTDGKSRWADEAEFKESLSGGPVAAPRRDEPADDYEHPEAKFKSGLGGGSGSASRARPAPRRRVEAPRVVPRVGKGAWENPDDWKDDF